MKLNIYFACPACGRRIQISGECDEGETSWQLDIKALESSEETEEVEYATDYIEEAPKEAEGGLEESEDAAEETMREL